MDFDKKEMLAYVLHGVLPLMTFFALVFLKVTGWELALGIAFVVCICTYLIATKLLLNDSLLLILRKKMLMALDINSTGVMAAYVVNLRNSRYVDVNVNGNWFTTFFDRHLLVPFLKPKMVEGTNEGDYTVIKIPRKPEEYGKAVFGWKGMQVFLYNSVLGTFITKEMLSNQENKMTINHAILQLNERVQTLHNNIAAFYRFVIDKSLKKDWLGGLNWILIIVVIIIIVLVVLFNQPILEFFNKMIGGAAAGVGKAGSTIRTPIPAA